MVQIWPKNGSNGPRINVICAYSHPRYTYEKIHRSLSCLDNEINKLDQNLPLVYLGDMNIDLLDYTAPEYDTRSRSASIDERREERLKKRNELLAYFSCASAKDME